MIIEVPSGKETSHVYRGRDQPGDADGKAMLKIVNERLVSPQHDAERDRQ